MNSEEVLEWIHFANTTSSVSGNIPTKRTCTREHDI